MKKVKCMVLTILAFAFAALADTTYTWTGNAGDGLWSSPNNWDRGSGYPSSATHIALFSKAATVTIDTGAQLTVGYIKVTGGDVTVNGTDGSYLTLDHAVVSTTSGYENGFVVHPGCTLTMNVPMVSSKRVDKWRDGTVVINAPYTNTASTYAFIMGQGTNVVSGSGSVILPNSNLQVGNGRGDANGHTTLLVEDGATIKASTIEMSISDDYTGGRIIQSGANSLVETVGNLIIGQRVSAKPPTTSYTLKDGTLIVGGNVHLGQNTRDSLFRQEGGVSSLDNFIFTNDTGRVELAGGLCYTDYSGFITRGGSSSTFAFSGGTLMTTTNDTPSIDVSLLELSGTPTLMVASGKTLALPENISVADGTVFTQSGGTVESYYDLEAAGELVITNGTFRLNNGTITPKLNSTTPLKLTVQDGGTFFMRRIDSRLAVPVDLAISGSGKIAMANAYNGYYNRSVIVAHSFTIDGVAQPKGRYAAGTSYFTGLGPSSIVVCYVWTGAGDGTSWNDAANWDGNAVPPSGTTTCVDISRAAGGTITIDDDITLSFIGFMPSGLERSVTIAGSGTIMHSGGAWTCGAFVREGCEIVLEAKVTRQSDTTSLSILGGGLVRVRSTFPGLNKNNTPSYCLDCEVVYEGAIDVSTTAAYKQIGYYTHEAQGVSKVTFAEGCTGANSNPFRVMHSPGGGFYQADAFVQEGGSLSMNDLFITRHNQAVRTPFSYTLNGGSLTLQGNVALGQHFTSSWPSRWDRGDFEMNGGTLTLNAFCTDCNNNHFYLNGGDVYLKAGFTQSTGFLERRAVTNIVLRCVHLGGVTIHSTANWNGNLTMELTGVNGDVTFDTAGYNASINKNISGVGGLVKNGAGTLTLSKTNTFTGSITVNGGIVTLPAGSSLDGPSEIIVNDGTVNLLGTVDTAPDSITVPSESSITLASDVTVKRFVVGGVPQADGTYPVSGGNVVVASGLATVWQGASGGTWSLTDNWTGGIPNGTDAVADFGASSTLGAGGDVELDTDVTLGELAFANNVTNTALTVSGDNTLTMGGGATIYVGLGQTLTIDAPLAMTQGYLYKKGEGRLVLNGSVTGASTGAGYYLLVMEGELEVNGTVRNCRLWASNNDGGHAPRIIIGEDADVGSYSSAHAAWQIDTSKNNDHGHVVQNGGVVDLNPPAYGFAGSHFSFGRANANSAGSYTLNGGTLSLYKNYKNYLATIDTLTFDFIQNGGTFNAWGLYLTPDNSTASKTSYTLNGGTLVLQTRFFSPGSGMCDVTFNGGTILTETSPYIFDSQRLPVTLGGDVTFTQSVSTAALLLANTISGEGTFRQAGPGSLALRSPNYFTGTVAVDGGTLQLDAPQSVTNYVATSGIFKFTDGALPLKTDSVIDMGSSGELDLDYDGEAVVKELWANGRQRPAGTYSATSGHSVSPRISGAGALVVLEGREEGTYIILR